MEFQYKNYTTTYSLNKAGDEFYIRVTNNIELKTYDTTITKANSICKLQMIKKIFDSCLSDNSNINFVLADSKITLECNYNNVCTFNFELNVHDVVKTI